MASTPSPVPKPSQSGAAKTGLANTKLDYANIRNGPSTNHKIVGELRDLTLCTFYPSTQTGDGWIWVEQNSVGGWVSSTVVTFEDPPAAPPTGPTPYTGAVAIWHWRGDSVAENTIEDFAKNIRANAPYVTQIWVKTSDWTETSGARWMGYWDTKRNLAIDGPSSIDRWVQTLARYNLETHLWCVPRGGDPDTETSLIVQACLRAGVKSMILDIEPYSGFWQGGREGIRPFMLKIRSQIPGAFHIGMAVDPRAHHFDTIFPDEWKPFINSIHPMAYWSTMRRTPDDILNETYQVWSKFGRPIIPALQTDAPVSEMEQARSIAIVRHKAVGLSWWRAGIIGPVEFGAINRPMSDTTPPKPRPPQIIYGEEQIIKPGGEGYNDFSYTGNRELQEFTNVWGWKAFYTATQPKYSRTAARWTPRFKTAAKYDVSVFISARHSTTANARYKIHGVTGSNLEVVVPVDQSLYSNQWVSLGIFDFDPRSINAGTVFLNDLTGEEGREISFDAVRWQEVTYIENPGPGGPVPDGYADGYDQPMGTEEERASSTVWGGKWYDASPFGKLYFVGTPSEAYHTGADLNLPKDADAHSGVYATASGTVVFASRLPIWGNVIIIKHDPLHTNGQVMYSRYGHVENMTVEVGERVKRGQQISDVSNAYGRFAYHLHFDLSPTTVLEQNPEDWPGKDRTRLLKNYVDPKEFIAKNRPQR